MSIAFNDLKSLPQWVRLVIFFCTLPLLLALIMGVAAEATINGFIMAVLQIMMPTIVLPPYPPTPLQQTLDAYCEFLS